MTSTDIKLILVSYFSSVSLAAPKPPKVRSGKTIHSKFDAAGKLLHFDDVIRIFQRICSSSWLLSASLSIMAKLDTAIHHFCWVEFNFVQLR